MSNSLKNLLLETVGHFLSSADVTRHSFYIQALSGLSTDGVYRLCRKCFSMPSDQSDFSTKYKLFAKSQRDENSHFHNTWK